ncbi:TPA: tRNA pseudouridine(38-40) synthase TruA [bacterium]|nr:tRNA pseudouridine(38-40) synthase TruA [bacterium]
MPTNIKLTLSYDGTNYHGWQIQRDLPTASGTLKEAILKLTGEEVQLIAASRTDAGAHALSQVVNFKTSSLLPVSSYPKALNAHLPQDIVVYAAEEVDGNFHARFSAKKRIYEYVILNLEYPAPIYRNYAHWVEERLNLKKMKKAIGVFIGQHDFTSFTSSAGGGKNPIRKIDKISIYEHKDFIRIQIEGDSFLPGMVRTIVASLIEVGLGRLDPVKVKQILEARDRALTPPPAPACGLYLAKVKY